MYLFKIIDASCNYNGYTFHKGPNITLNGEEKDEDTCIFFKSVDLNLFEVVSGKVCVVLVDAEEGASKEYIPPSKQEPSHIYERCGHGYKIKQPYVECIISIYDTELWEVFKEFGFPRVSDKFAIYSGKIEIIKYILLNGFETSFSIWRTCPMSHVDDYIKIAINSGVEMLEEDIAYCLFKCSTGMIKPLLDYATEKKINFSMDSINFNNPYDYSWVIDDLVKLGVSHSEKCIINAVLSGHWEVVRMLKKYGSTHLEKAFLVLCGDTKNIENVEKFIGILGKIPEGAFTAAVLSKNGGCSLVKMLLENGADVEDKGLDYIIYKFQMGLISLVLNMRPDVFNRALIIALNNCQRTEEGIDASRIKFILSHKFPIDESIINYVIHMRDLEFLKAMIELKFPCSEDTISYYTEVCSILRGING